MKVLLLTPIISRKELWGQYEKGGGAYFPLGLLSLAAVAQEAGKDVTLIDASTLGWNEYQLREYLKTNTYDIVGVGNCYTALVHIVFRTACLCKEVLPEAKLVVGGIHPTLFPEETLKVCEALDICVHGEGELTFLEMIDFFENGNRKIDNVAGIAYRSSDGSIVVNRPRSKVRDLSSIPQLPYDLLDVQRYVPPPSNYKRLPTFGFLVQRGCPYECTYCDPRIHGKRVRHDSIDKIISKMKYLVKKYGMKGIIFHDSCITINRDFSVSLFQRMIDEKFDLSWTCFTRVDKVDFELLKLMKKSGCWSVAYGLESANNISLKRMRKGTTVEQNIEAVRLTKAAELQAIGSFILCLPGEDEQMTLNTIEFAKRLRLDTAVFFLPVPFYGTELYDMCKEEGGLLENIKWEDFKQWMDQENPLYINPRIGKKKMVELYNYAVRSFYLSPHYILQCLKHVRSIADFRKYFTGFSSLLEVFRRDFKHKT